jgi:hypothetical protein
MAGKDNMVGGAELVAGEVGTPRGIDGREETLNSGRARSVLVDLIGREGSCITRGQLVNG